MRILRIDSIYKDYIQEFYRGNPDLIHQTYDEQKAVIDYDAFGTANFWSQVMNELNYEMTEIYVDIEPLQRTWAREQGIRNYQQTNLDKITLEQVKSFKPDILWVNNYKENLLQEIRKEVPSLRFVLGWVGSAIPKTNIWRYIDLILSCAPETVECLNCNGFRAEHLDHGFAHQIIQRLKESQSSIDVSFIGQIIRNKQFHLEREQILSELIERKVNLHIFTPSAGISLSEEIYALIRRNLFRGMNVLKKLGVPENTLTKIPKIGRAALWEERPLRPVNPRLKPFFKTAVFGLNMYQTIKDSKLILNIHADSSPKYASNMRLFETTGVGTCLITDWKENIKELFEPDREVVTYKSTDECVEKIQWLLNHPLEREIIAKRGQERTLREHCFTKRSLKLDEIIRRELKKFSKFY
jgi:spore maturation protein CgeB